MPTVNDVKDTYTVQVSLQDDVSLQANKVSNAFDSMAQSAGRAVDANEAFADATGTATRAQAEFNSVLNDWSAKAAATPQQLAAMTSSWDALGQSAGTGAENVQALNTALGNAGQAQAQSAQSANQSRAAFGDLKTTFLDTALAGGVLRAAGSGVSSGLSSMGSALGQVGSALSTFALGQRTAAEQTGNTTKAMNEATTASRASGEAASGLGSALSGSTAAMASAAAGLGLVAQAATASGGSLGSFIARIGPLGLAFGGLVAGISTVVVGLAAMGKAYNDAQEAQDKLARSMEAVRDDAGIVGAQVQATAKEVAASTPQTVDAARKVAATIAAQSNYSPSMDLTGLTVAASNLADATGKSFEAAGQQIANALKDTAAAAKTAADEGIKGFDNQLVATIDLMQTSGDRADAFNRYMAVMKAATNGAASEVKPLQQALKDLADTLSPERGGLAAVMGGFLKDTEEGFARLLENITHVVQTLQSLGANWLPSVFGDKSPGAVTRQPGFDPSQPITTVPTYDVGQHNLDLINHAFATLADGMTTTVRETLYGFTTQVMHAESNGEQYDARGQILRSSRGALGRMQLMPATGEQYSRGENYLTEQGNVDAGLNLILHLNDKYHGDLVKMAIAYNWGEGNADKFFAGLKPGLPAETVGFVQKTTGLSGEQLQARFADQIGQGQFRDQIYRDADKLPLTASTAAQQREAAANIELITKSLTQARQDYERAVVSGDEDARTKAIRQIAEYHDKLDAALAVQKNIRSETQQYAADQVAAAESAGKHLDDLNQKLYDYEKKIRDAASKSGQPVDQQSLATGLQAIRDQDAAETIDKQNKLAEAFEKQTTAMDEANKKAIEYATTQGKSGTVTKDASDYIRAYTEVTQKGIEPGEKFNELLAARVKVLGEAKQVQNDAQARQDVQDFAAQNEQLQDQYALIGKNTKATAELNAEMEERHKWHKTLHDDLTLEQQAAVDAAKANADLKDSIQQQRQAVQELGQMFSSVFDSVANSITDAFVKGKGAAIDFGGIMKGLAAQIAKDFLQLAILNPIANMFSMGGQTKPTLSTLISAVGSMSGGGSGTTGSGGSAFGSVQSGASLLNSANSLSSNWISDSLGLTGQNGLTSTVGSWFGGSGNSLSSFLGSASSVSAPATQAQMLAANSISGASYTTPGTGLIGGVQGALNTSLFGTATAGNLIGGVGAGYTAGSLVGGAIQGGMGKVGPAPEIGAAAGAVSGAIIGSIIPGIGTLLGGLIGGLIGGGGGGFIGPKAPSAYSSEVLTTSGGLLQGGRFLSQKDPNAEQEAKTFSDQINALNNTLQANNLQIIKQNGMLQLGINTPGKYVDPTKFADLQTANVTGQTALQQFRFGGSSDDILNAKLADKSFATIDDLTKYLTGYNQAQAAAKTYLTATTETLKNLGVQTGALNDQVNGLNAAYDNDKAAMDGLINSGYLSEQQTNDMVKAEGDLAAIRDKSVAAAYDAANRQTYAADVSLTGRYLQAQAQMSGSVTDAHALQTYQFDTGAETQRQNFSQQLLALYGDSWKSSKEYADQMAQLERTLGAERLAIAKSYNDQISAEWKTIIVGIEDIYVRYYEAHAKNTGNVNSQVDADLYAFQVQAQRQREVYDKQLQGAIKDGLFGWATYNDAMASLNRTLAEEQQQIIQQYWDKMAAEWKVITSGIEDIYVRYYQAHAKNTGSAGDQVNANLYSFDVQANREREAYSKQLHDAMTDGLFGWKTYYDAMGSLEKTLGEERLEIIKQYNDQIQAEWKSAVQAMQDIDVRYYQAYAKVTGASGASKNADLYAFDIQAGRQRDTYAKQLQTAMNDGLLTAATYNAALANLEKTLGQERLAIVKQYDDQLAAEWKTVVRGTQGLDVRYYQALAKVTGQPGDAKTADLYAFDIQAQQEREDYAKQLSAAMSDGLLTAANYNDGVAKLEKTLGEERLAIVKQYADQIKQKDEQLAQSALGGVSNLQSYVTKLATSNQSPLSPQAQYDLASKQFNAVYGAAAAGNYNSLQNLTGYADSLLQASSAYYGTGTQYVADFNRVLNSINSLASMSPDQLTAAVYQQETRSATQQLVDALAQIRNEVATLRAQIAQGSLAPSRLAA